MKHFVVEITYLVPFESLDDLRPAHRSFLQTGYDKGWLLMSGPLVPPTRAMVVARAPEMADLQAFFADDPYQYGVGAPLACPEGQAAGVRLRL